MVSHVFLASAPLQGPPPAYLSSGSSVSTAPAPSMVGDDIARLVAAEATAALQQHVSDKMNALQAAEAHARMHAIALLLEEHAFITTLEAKVVVAALQQAPTTASSSEPPPPPFGGDAVIIAMLHVQANGVQNICSLVSTVLNPSSLGYACWCD
jgi:hypothetical protein